MEKPPESTMKDPVTVNDVNESPLCSNISSDTHVGDNLPDSDSKNPLKRRKLELYAADVGPRLYNVDGNIVSQPLIVKNLPSAFDFLPIHGRPQFNVDLSEFQRNKLREFVGCDLNEEEFDKLSQYCSVDYLKTGKELVITTQPSQFDLEKMLTTNEMEPNENLCITKKFKLRQQKDTSNLYIKQMKYRGVKTIPLQKEDFEHQVITIGEPLQPGKDILLRLRVYRPFKYGNGAKIIRHSICSYDIVLLGRHKLNTLRDRFVCANDLDMRIDVSDRPEEVPESSSKELFPSGFLFINNVFYVDTRPGCKDLTSVIRQWAEARGYGKFPCKDMCSVKMEDLVIKLGHPEVYVHQGNCEHLFTFSEVRVLTSSDPLRLNNYPSTTLVSAYQTVYCTTCGEFGAKWIVVGCTRVPFEPSYFCETCFKLYLYMDKKKIGDFKAYSFRGNELNVFKPSVT